MLDIIREINRETTNEVIRDEGVTNTFKTKRWVGQERSLSFILFNILIDGIEDVWGRKNKECR